jgi:C4-dicarboxylate-specific signal transduction histidine kinase
MATGIAHEINQPLNNISMTVDNILYDIHEKRSVDVNYIEGKAQKLFANITRMRNLIDHIRLFARSHEDPLNNTFQVNEGINNALSMIGAELRHLDIEIDIRLASDLPILEGSIYKFEQVILNLMLNAKDGLEEKRQAGEHSFKMEIKVSSRLEGDEVIVEVEDNGAGIDEDKLPQIFVPFFSTKDEGKGTGLGLSISFGIIKQFNGRIEILSKKHIFTKAVISLPVANNMSKKIANN